MRQALTPLWPAAAISTRICAQPGAGLIARQTCHVAANCNMITGLAERCRLPATYQFPRLKDNRRPNRLTFLRSRSAR
jgi:hypothetical protein